MGGNEQAVEGRGRPSYSDRGVWTDRDAKCLTVISLCSPTLSSLRVCVCSVSALPTGLKSQHQVATSRSLAAWKRRRRPDVQHQKVSPMSLVIFSGRQESRGVLKWLPMIMADICARLPSADDYRHEKMLMESPGKKAHKLRLENFLSTFWREFKNPVYASPSCVCSLFSMWLYVHDSSAWLSRCGPQGRGHTAQPVWLRGTTRITTCCF